MLGMAFFKSLVKQHGTTYFEPMGQVLASLGVKQPNPLNPAHLWALKGPMSAYGSWLMGQYFVPKSRTPLPSMPDRLRRHAEFAAEELQNSPLEISAAMRKHQLKLADRQCRMSELSARVQKLIVILCTSLYGARQDDEVIQSAADVVCQDFTRELTGRRPSDRYFRAITGLGEMIVDGGFQSIAGLKPDEILMPYENND
jgi:hypothetical protein